MRGPFQTICFLQQPNGGALHYPCRPLRHSIKKGLTMKLKLGIDIRLERDFRYVAANAKLRELQAEVASLEKERSDIYEGISSLAQRKADALEAEAQALLSGEKAPAANKRAQLTDSLGEVEHKIAVRRQAIDMQKREVERLVCEVSTAISKDLLPTHRANVRDMAFAALEMEKACRMEADLRDDLRQKGVRFTGTLRPMPISGFDTRDPNSLLSRFLLECVEYGFLSASEVSDPLRERAVFLSRRRPEPRPA
jgi:hypothetical protein